MPEDVEEEVEIDEKPLDKPFLRKTFPLEIKDEAKEVELEEEVEEVKEDNTFENNHLIDTLQIPGLEDNIEVIISPNTSPVNKEFKD